MLLRTISTCLIICLWMVSKWCKTTWVAKRKNWPPNALIYCKLEILRPDQSSTHWLATTSLAATSNVTSLTKLLTLKFVYDIGSRLFTRGPLSPGVDVIIHLRLVLRWNNALWLVKTSHMSFSSHSEGFTSV